MNIAAAQDTSQGDRYEHPTPQVIYVKGTSPVITISIPLLQQYYININRKNQDYAYFQVAYYDFPQQRALDKALKLSRLRVGIKYVYYSSPAVGERTMHTSYGNIEIPLTGIMTLDEFAAQVRTQLLIAGMLAANTSQTHVAIVLGMFKDFIYDPASEKFVMLWGYSAAPFPQTVPSTTLPILGGELTFGNALTADGSIDPEHTLTEKQALYCARVFGGSSEGTQWSSRFAYDDTNRTLFAYEALRERTQALDTDLAKHIYPNFQQLVAYSYQSPGIGYLGNYVYIRGAPEPSYWNTDGTKSDIAAILPLNRTLNKTVGIEQAYLAEKTHMVKTPLNSLRVMRLYLTDEDGELLEFDEDYTLQIQINFNID